MSEELDLKQKALDIVNLSCEVLWKENKSLREELDNRQAHIVRLENMIQSMSAVYNKMEK